MSKIPTAPPGTKAAGRRLWHEVLGRFELDQHEQALLREAVRVVDLLDVLSGIVIAEGPLVDGRVHAAVVEQRQQRIVLARLIASLRLPDDADERPQRRGSARGTYRKPLHVVDGA